MVCIRSSISSGRIGNPPNAAAKSGRHSKSVRSLCFIDTRPSPQHFGHHRIRNCERRIALHNDVNFRRASRRRLHDRGSGARRSTGSENRKERKFQRVVVFRLEVYRSKNDSRDDQQKRNEDSPMQAGRNWRHRSQEHRHDTEKSDEPANGEHFGILSE